MPCNTWHDPQQSGHPVTSAERRCAGTWPASPAAMGATGRAAGRGAGRPRRDRRLPVRRAAPAGLPVLPGAAGGQLARRGAPHPGRAGAVPGAVRRLRSRRVPAALLLRVGRRRPRLRRLVPGAAAGVPGVLARLLRAACPPGPAGNGKHRGRDRRRGRLRRDLLRRGRLVRHRPGRLALPRAQHRRAVRRPVDAPHARRHRRRDTARRRGPHQADRARRTGRGARRAAYSARAAGSPASPRSPRSPSSASARSCSG